MCEQNQPWEKAECEVRRPTVHAPGGLDIPRFSVVRVRKSRCSEKVQRVRKRKCSWKSNIALQK